MTLSAWAGRTPMASGPSCRYLRRHRATRAVRLTTFTFTFKDAQAIPVRQFDAIIGAIADNIRRGKVLIHCGSGVSRAPIMLAAYLHLVGYADFDKALVEIAGLRPSFARRPFC